MKNFFIFASGFCVSVLMLIGFFLKEYKERSYPISYERSVFAENRITYKSNKKSLWFKISSENLYITSSYFDEFINICRSVEVTPIEFLNISQGNQSGEDANGDIFRVEDFSAPEFIDQNTCSLILEDNHYFWGSYITKDEYGDVMHNIYYFPRKEAKNCGYIVIANIKTR